MDGAPDRAEPADRGATAEGSHPSAPSRADPERVRRVAQAMRIDHWTASVVTAMRDAGIRPMLLKGPVIANWLYGGDRAERTYGDADVLVGPPDLDSARMVLSQLEFTCSSSLTATTIGGPLRHAECWFRERDHAAVDLHQHLHSTEHLPAAQVWALVAGDAEVMEVGGVAVEVPSEPVRALHAVLHVRPRDHPGSQAWSDLDRAIVQVDPSVWDAARTIAGELGIEAEMGALLRLLPAGAPLADRLGLPHHAPRYLVLQHDPDAPGAARFVERVRSLPPVDAIRVLARKAFPAPHDVRRGWPVARRGPLGLVGAYVWRLALVPVRLGQWARFHVASRATGLRRR